MTMISENAFRDKLSEVEHPEIDVTLENLGMIRDVLFNSNENLAEVTLVLPVLSIPASIRNMLIEGLTTAAREVGVELTVSTAEMNPQERHVFIEMARTYWRAEGTDVIPCGS